MCDFYAVGVLTYELWAGFTPWGGNSVQEVYKSILKTELTFPKHFSTTAKHFIKACMTRNKEKRLGSQNGVIELLKHPFLYGSFKIMSKHKGKTIGPLSANLTQYKNAREKRLSVFMDNKNIDLLDFNNKQNFGNMRFFNFSYNYWDNYLLEKEFRNSSGSNSNKGSTKNVISDIEKIMRETPDKEYGRFSEGNGPHVVTKEKLLTKRNSDANGNGRAKYKIFG